MSLYVKFIKSPLAFTGEGAKQVHHEKTNNLASFTFVALLGRYF